MHVSGVPNVDPERAFFEHLPVIDRILAVVARRHALSASDAEEFASWAKARVIESDYAVFRKFCGRSSMRTYLSVVFGRLFLDYRNSLWGRWRPSAAAQRRGPIGIRLDELLHRDGYTLREAQEVLRTCGASETDAEIGRIAAGLPVRQPSTEVALDAVEGTLLDGSRMGGKVESDEAGLDALRDALSALPLEDQVIMRMLYWDDTSIADIARTLQLEQKPLYRRIDSIQESLRELLGLRGVERDRARDMLSREEVW